MLISQKNNLLNVLSAEVQLRLVRDLKLVTLSKGMILCESGDTMPNVYFPIDSIISLQNATEDGASTEISAVGFEGMVGIAVFMGGGSDSSRAVVESAGAAYCLSSKKFKEEFNRHGEMMLLMLRYAQSLMTQISQNAICNRHHSVQQQVSRWLLRSLDRLPDNHLVMTQELIANMLGVRREGVTNAAGELQKRGVIEYGRGHITVLDRFKLEKASCECYSVVKKEMERLLPCNEYVSPPIPVRINTVARPGTIATKRHAAPSLAYA